MLGLDVDPSSAIFVSLWDAGGSALINLSFDFHLPNANMVLPLPSSTGWIVRRRCRGPLTCTTAGGAIHTAVYVKPPLKLSGARPMQLYVAALDVDVHPQTIKRFTQGEDQCASYSSFPGPLIRPAPPCPTLKQVYQVVKLIGGQPPWK